MYMQTIKLVKLKITAIVKIISTMKQIEQLHIWGIMLIPPM